MRTTWQNSHRIINLVLSQLSPSKCLNKLFVLPEPNFGEMRLMNRHWKVLPNMIFCRNGTISSFFLSSFLCHYFLYPFPSFLSFFQIPLSAYRLKVNVFFDSLWRPSSDRTWFRKTTFVCLKVNQKRRQKIMKTSEFNKLDRNWPRITKNF